MDRGFSADLSAFLDAAAVADRYEIAHTLKSTPQEITQVVYRIDASGERTAGPFVRKIFAGERRHGGAYGRILRAQTAGVTLRHQPVIYECEDEGAQLVVVMEYVRGETLLEHVRREGAGADCARRTFPALCDAATELHELGDQPIIHRDIKPANVMVSGSRLVLIDLGIARTYRTDAKRDTVRYGTPGYAPPEQYGYGQTDVTSDVYALGMTLAFCLTGEEPTPALREGGFEDRRIPHELRPVLVRATEFDPAARYGSARELRDAFSDALGGQRTTPSASQPGPTPRFTTVGKVWNTLLATFFALVVFVSVMVSLRPDPGNEIIANSPFWFRIVAYCGMIHLPLALLIYLLMDKRRLKQRTPLSRYTWRQEVPFCLLVSFVSILVICIAYNFLFRPR